MYVRVRKKVRQKRDKFSPVLIDSLGTWTSNFLGCTGEYNNMEIGNETYFFWSHRFTSDVSICDLNEILLVSHREGVSCPLCSSTRF